MSDSTTGTAPRRAAGADLAADAARRLIDALVRTGSHMDADAADLANAMDALTARIRRLAPCPADRIAEMWSGTGPHRHDPCSGTDNPLAPPLTLDARKDGSLEGRVSLGLPYQGPPGMVHGGISALLLDHALGLANTRSGVPAVTAELMLRYLRPIPLFREVTVTARHVRLDGRKVHAEGALSVDDRVCVTASGLFVVSQRTSHDRTNQARP